MLSSWSFEPLSVPGSLRLLCGYFREHASRHHVLRCSRRPRQLPCPSSSCASLDQVVQFSRNLLSFVVFCEVVKRRSLVHSSFQPGGSASFGLTPFSHVIGYLQAREFLRLLPPQVHLPMMNPVRIDRHLRRCCWSTCMDNSRRCALAHRSRSSIGYRSCPCPCPCPCPCLSLCPSFHVPVNLLSKLPPLEPCLASSLAPGISFGDWPSINSFSLDATSLLHWFLSCLIPSQHCVSSTVMCRLRVVCANTPKIHWHRAHHQLSFR